MPILRVYKRFEVTVDGIRRDGGYPETPRRITIDGDVLDQTRSLATATTWDVWVTSAENPLTDFKFLWIESYEQDVIVEITTDKDADVGTVISTITVSAGDTFALGDNQSYAGHTADFAAGTLDVIDQIRIRNVSGSTANVRVFMVS